MKAIIFDMDGVIINSEPMHVKLEREILEELGGTITDEDHSNFIGTTDYHMWSTLKEQFHIGLSVDEIMKIKMDRFNENIHRIELVPGFWDFFIKVFNAGHPLALASSNNKTFVNLIVERFNLDKYLKVIMTGEDVNEGKPHPEIFLKTAEKLGVPPSNCIVIEDAKNGVLAAKAAGMKCIGFNNPVLGKQDLSRADLVVDDFNQLDFKTIYSL